MKTKPKVRPFYRPLTLVARQALSVFHFAWLTKWKKFPNWVLKASKNLHIAAGAVGMGCIGFPVHPVWEVTSACNLRCRHCHATSGKPDPHELNTQEGKKLITEIAAIDEFRMLVFSGGEPLLRKDIFELVEYASSLGLEVVIATNGTLITPNVAKRLKKADVCDVAVGIDGASASTHDYIRGPGAFERAMQGIYAAREAGLAIQFNVTVMKCNYHEIPAILDLAHQLDAEIVLLYHLIPMGRGQNKNLELTRAQFMQIAKLTREKQKQIKPIVEPTCFPQYWAYLLKTNNTSRLGLKFSQIIYKGCVAGSGLCYIKPNGEVWPCPFIPISGGNVRKVALKYIWNESEVFSSLKGRENLKGRCNECCYKNICGGCRGRAYAHSGDYLAEDPLCFLSQD